MTIINPTVDERDIASLVDKLLQVAPNEGDTLEKVDVWGKHCLAHDIDKYSEGARVVADMKATLETVQELDR